MKRIDSIDIMRGLVMLIMTLDHTRDLLHITSIAAQPTDLSVTTPLLFFTRWITHLCAPTFVFLSGASAYLAAIRRDNPAESKSHLLKRGIWLIILDLTLVNFGVWFDIHFNVFLFDVLSAIGVGFIVLSFLLKTSAKTIGITGLLIIALHNLSPLVPLEETPLVKTILMPLFGPGAFNLGNGITFVMGYPPISWLGIILVGFSTGRLFLQPELLRKKIYLKIAMVCLLLFACLRGINIYGDSFPWQRQPTGLFTFLSFINITKYPPSLQFCLLTLGMMFLILFSIEGIRNKFTDFAAVFGKVPLFYFVIHWYLIHAFLFSMVFMQGFKYSDLLFGFNFGRPKGSGVGLGMIYLIWIIVVILLYPICSYYSRYKEQNRDKKWLSYL